MAAGAVGRAAGPRGGALAAGGRARRDGVPEVQVRPASRDRLDVGRPLSRVVTGVEVGETMPVKVKKSGFTVKGTAVVTELSDQASVFEIHIRDRVFGKKIEKNVEVAVRCKPDGSYRFTKTDGDGVEQGDVTRVRVDGPTTAFTVPDAKKGGKLTEVRFTDLGQGHFRIRGADFSAEFNG